MGIRSFLAAYERAYYVDCFGCLAWPVVSSDLWVLGFITTALGVTYLIPSLLLRWMLGTAAVGALLAYGSDIAVTSLLNRRLHLEDVINYGTEVPLALCFRDVGEPSTPLVRITCAARPAPHGPRVSPPVF